MQLTLREVADYLGVSEGSARRWITQRALPAHRVNERLYFNAIEVWEWAVENGVAVSRRLLEQARRTPDEVPPIATLLRSGGVLRDVEGATKRNILECVVARLPLPAGQDRHTLLSVLEAREAMGSTGVGDGIAIPHVRNPLLLQVDEPFVTLALLRQPVDFEAIDNQPVHALFFVVSPTVPVHLRILAQLGFLLRDDVLRRMLRDRAPTEEILGRVDYLESTRTTGSFAVSNRKEPE